MKDLAKDTADDDTSVELITSDPVKGVPFNDEAFAREDLLGAVRLESSGRCQAWSSGTSQMPASGGSVSSAENGCPPEPSGSASMPPRLPMSLPP
jgi:hypothetical protein